MAGSAMTAPPWMPWRVVDDLAITQGWPLVAVGIYHRLIAAQWLAGDLPCAETELRAIAGANVTEWKRSRAYIEPRFPIADDGRRRDPAIAAIRADSVARYARQVERARKAARARWDVIDGGRHD